MRTTKSHLSVSTFVIWAWLLKLRQNENATVQASIPSEETVERGKLEERLCEVQRNARSVWRAVRVMVFLTALAVVGLGYSTVLIPDWPQTMRQFFMFLPVRAHCALGLASLSCGVFFSALGLLYGRELTSLREQCQRLAGEIVEPADARIIPLPVESSVITPLAEPQPVLIQSAA